MRAFRAALSPPHRGERRRALRLAVSALALILALPEIASAQTGLPPVVLQPGQPAGTAPTFAQTRARAPMIVNAQQLIYDNNTGRATARGRVEIVYEGRIVLADEVTYDQRTDRVSARGNVRISEPSGNVAYAEALELDQEFKNGFVRSLNIETPDRRRIGALRATREGGETTVFEGATYTAGEPWGGDPAKPPLWQIRAKRVIHKNSEKTVYFEDARFEFFGTPIAYLPYFWAPDGTERKKSGFLFPQVTASDRTGIGLEIPYFWNIAPNYDLLIAPVIYSRQGFMPRAEWRHATETGSYFIRGAAISQLAPSAFPASESGNRRLRGYVQTAGEFRITDQWRLGWDVTLLSDPAFLRDYSLLAPGQSEANQRIFLRGQGARSWFDLSATRFVGITATDVNNKVLPFTHPQLDYFKVLDQSIFGGEFSWRTNVTSLSRERADFSSRWNAALGNSFCDGAQPAGFNAQTLLTYNDRRQCLVHGVDGTYTRASVDFSWRRRIIDQLGQVWEPYFSVRGDVSSFVLRNDAATLASYNALTGDAGRVHARVMPTAALTYRYPFVAGSAAGVTTVEPIVQFVARPNETLIGRLPNEDAQSLVFDDTNLFSTNKFSGWDRIEGGGRLNYGVSVGHRFVNGSYLNVLVGQSYHLFGINSFAYGDPTAMGQPLDTASAGAHSGLERPRSDYVARVNFEQSRDLRFAARTRFDQSTLSLQRGELEVSGRYGAFAGALTYAYLAPQPWLGYVVARSGITGALSYRLTDNWTLYGAARFAFLRQNPVNATQDRSKIEGLTLGVSYLDESFQFGLFYSRDFASIVTPGSTDVRDVHRFMLRLNLRTLGETTLTQNASNWFNPPQLTLQP